MLITIIGGLHVYPDRMRTNLDLTGGLITAEAVMTALAGTVGRQQADDIVHHAALQASTTGGTFPRHPRRRPPGQVPGAGPMNTPWRKSAVVYQIYPANFANGDRDGIGHGPGIIDAPALPPRPRCGRGLASTDYARGMKLILDLVPTIEPGFGTLIDFDRLLAAVHAEPVPGDQGGPVKGRRGSMPVHAGSRTYSNPAVFVVR